MKISIPDIWLQPGAWPARLPHLAQQESAVVVCYGDSITHGFDCETGLQVMEPYPARLSSLLQAQGGPHIRLVNAGHNGWTTDDGRRSLDPLVLSRQPDVVLLMFGLNDAYQDMPLDHFRENLLDMGKRITAQGSLLLLMPPTPVVYLPGVEVPDYVAAARHAASRIEGAGFFDLHAAIIEYLDRGFADPDDLLPDGVHFSPAGYQLLGELVFGAWGRLG